MSAPLAVELSRMPKKPVDTGAPLLFCPFCRECFEGERECPEHELALVPFEDLPREPDPEAGDLPRLDQPVGAFEPRFGRGFLMAGVLVSIVGFVMPVLHVVQGGQGRAWSGFEAAVGRAPNLWTIPFVAAMFAWMLMRRRSPLEMLGARLVGVVLAVAPLASLAYTAWSVERGAAELGARGARIETSLEYGVFVLALGAVLLLVGSLRFGVMRLPSAAPSDADTGTASRGARG